MSNFQLTNEAGSTPDAFKRLSGEDEAVLPAIHELVDWCIRNQRLLEQGRRHGFRLGVTPMFKDVVALTCSDQEVAQSINANLLDVKP